MRELSNGSTLDAYQGKPSEANDEEWLLRMADGGTRSQFLQQEKLHLYVSQRRELLREISFGAQAATAEKEG